MDHTPAPVSKKAIQQSEEFWKNFTFAGKIIVIAVCVTLALMALIFIDW